MYPLSAFISRSRLPYRAILPVVLLLCTVIGAYAVDPPVAEAIEGRWNLTVQMSGKEMPSWLEVTHSGHKTLVGQFVGVSGSARPIAKVEFSNGQLRFAIPPQWEQGNQDLVVEGRLQGEQLSGTMTFPDGKRYNWTARRAPALRRPAPAAWDTPITLFNGTSLDGWQAMGENQWQAVDGILRSPKSGSNLQTTRTFDDFKLHVEFRYPEGSNSGVYLRGRYEVQIEDSKATQPASGLFGGVYGFLAPSEMVNKKPGEWQTFDITLVGRMITVEANGKTIICNREIPGITGGALDSKEGEPGPLYLQGDHGPVEFRNIVLTPAKK
jgi:hypothetical protein